MSCRYVTYKYLDSRSFSLIHLTHSLEDIEQEQRWGARVTCNMV